MIEIQKNNLVLKSSKRTIDTYLYWIKQFIIFHNKRHPSELHNFEVEQFLTFLAVDQSVAVATHK